MSINRGLARDGGIVNLLHGAALQCVSRGGGWSTGGCEGGCRDEEDGFVSEGRRKGDLKSWTLIGGDERQAWVVLAVTFSP